MTSPTLPLLASLTNELHGHTHREELRRELDHNGLPVDVNRYVPRTPRRPAYVAELRAVLDDAFAAYALELIGGAA